MKKLNRLIIKPLERRTPGVTLVELMVVVALLAIIFIPLVRIFKSFTNAWWAGKARMTVQAEARDAMYWFVKDMKGAYRHTIGNLVRNGGFDSPDNISSTVIGWEEAAGGGMPSGVVKFSSVTTRGFCVGISTWAAFSSTFTFQLQDSVRYILTGKIWNTGLSTGKIEILTDTGANLSPTAISTETAHTTGWETVTADFVKSGNDTCIIRLSNTTAGIPCIAYFENISVAPKTAVLVGAASAGKWKVPTEEGYPFISEIQTDTGYTKYLARYKIEVTTDSANVLRNRIWRQKAKSDLASFTNPNDWESIDFNHIAEYCERLEIGYDVPSAFLAQNGTDTGISINIEFKRSAAGNVMQPYNMKTYIYPQSP